MNGCPDDRPIRLRGTVAVPGVECDACGGRIGIGEQLAVYSTAPHVVHDGGCPPRWTPLVVHGEGRDTQRRLSFLTVVQGGAR